MNLASLHFIIADCTQQFRKGPAVIERDAGAVRVTEIFAMPHSDDAAADLIKIDLHFVIIGVDLAKAEGHRAELLTLLADYPDPAELSAGPSYIAVGARIGDQGAALCLFALGEALKLWKVITPAFLGLEGEQADEAAGSGYVLISGWRKDASVEAELRALGGES